MLAHVLDIDLPSSAINLVLKSEQMSWYRGSRSNFSSSSYKYSVHRVSRQFKIMESISRPRLYDSVDCLTSDHIRLKNKFLQSRVAGVRVEGMSHGGTHVSSSDNWHWSRGWSWDNETVEQWYHGHATGGAGVIMTRWCRINSPQTLQSCHLTMQCWCRISWQCYSLHSCDALETSSQGHDLTCSMLSWSVKKQNNDRAELRIISPCTDTHTL